ncbi:hypothetical protein [Winogradskyella psychrotolerans]|uniref:hypothetical protein n=1 Tax=Winogradskyella psychrotolerans TaxID=1344585 RepID=UPI001C072BBB|nr:hypothetical protein [Winogradskyella psychrotolerans]MBU2930145.1 hypothetical protein [Winogradskyella psychrotolerans]
MKNTITQLIAILITTLSFAQQGINYKALIKDDIGNVLVSQNIGVQFQIRETTANGTAVYTETHTATTDANGILILNIGTGTTSDTFSAIDWSSNEHWLNVQIDITGGTNYTDMSTAQFMAVPYAKYAKSAPPRPEYGDVKQGFQINDHNGWYILNGRDITTLPSLAQTQAISFGFNTNLPDAREKFLRHTYTPEAVGATGGATDNLIRIEQFNLPLLNFTGTAESKGSHTHLINPPNSVTSAVSNHIHAIDPPAVFTSSGGSHTHNAFAPVHDTNGAISQGYPQGDDHQSFRTSDRSRDRTVSSSAISSNGVHNHTLNIPSFNSTASGAHSHNLNIASFNSSSDGNHSHTVEVSSGGSGLDLNITPEYLSINNFIYLGQE